MPLGPKTGQVHELDHEQQGGLAHSGIREDEHLVPPIFFQGQASLKKLVDPLKGRLSGCVKQILLKYICRVTILQKGFNIDSFQGFRVNKLIPASRDSDMPTLYSA